MESDDQLTDQVRREVQRRMASQQAGHGWDHVERVAGLAMRIQLSAGGDRLVIELAALLHDLGDAKFHGGVERGAELSREVLAGFGADESITAAVCEIVESISFRKGVDPDTLSLEAKVVQDADRLDAIGAVGIVRTIEYGASIGQPFYSADPEVRPTGVQHFFDKLLKLRERLNTEAARELAGEREQFMRAFLNQFFEEVGTSPPSML